jgi:uncharacterized membrane protein YwaF
MNYIIPALLFSGISMFFNGYTIRYLKLSTLIRDFHQIQEKDENIIAQLSLFKRRLKYVKWVQFFSISSMFLATFSIFVGFLDFRNLHSTLFTISISSFLLSLIFSILEIRISTRALNISLKLGGKIL